MSGTNPPADPCDPVPVLVYAARKNNRSEYDERRNW